MIGPSRGSGDQHPAGRDNPGGLAGGRASESGSAWEKRALDCGQGLGGLR
jgi:hypothetical protein